MSVARQLGGWVRVLIVFVFLWGLLLFLFASKLNSPAADSGNTITIRLNQAFNYLEQSKQKNFELKELISELLRFVNFLISTCLIYLHFTFFLSVVFLVIILIDPNIKRS